MGIYIFKWKVLKELLEEDNLNKNSSHDFGKDIIPLLIEQNKKVVAYPFKGYWKDVGTVQSLWEANMDLLDEKSDLNISDYDWRIYTVNPNQPPQYISDEARVKESMINEGCIISGNIEKSIVFQGVNVGTGAVIRSSVIMPDAKIGENAYIEKAIVPSNIRIPDGMVIKPNNKTDKVVLVTEEMVNELIS
jgi:glucose-1-phosphate adenylyltransferase